MKKFKEIKPFSRTGSNPETRENEKAAVEVVNRKFHRDNITIIMDDKNAFAYGHLDIRGDVIGEAGSHFMLDERTYDEVNSDAYESNRQDILDSGIIEQTNDPLLGEFTEDCNLGKLSRATAIINTKTDPNGWKAWTTQDGVSMAEHRLEAYYEILKIKSSGIIESKVPKGSRVDSMELVIREAVKRMSV